jgi:hypothetical protein
MVNLVMVEYHWVFKVASCFCEYGVNQSSAVEYLNQYSAVDFTEVEILRTVQSAYKNVVPLA